MIMKRKDLTHYIENNGCQFLREGGNHTIYFNKLTRKVTSIPRHNEIFDPLANKICKDLGIPKVK
jgi:mRNA interferase HicA